MLMLDREHFNTFQLLRNEDKEFYYQGHNRIYKYFLVLCVIFICLLIFFLYENKKVYLKTMHYCFLVF